ncbi:MAG TPA: flagellar export chaperone FliS [Rhodocyclaceae bacterium]|nr:flagellar export chaperone FliS [Rhodocyclaceae bacterium]
MNTTAAINAYNHVGLETSVYGADPHKLVAMLFQGALIAVAKAKGEMLNKQTTAKGRFISKAIAIIGEGLNASLDKNVGGELAQNLSALYDYMVARLVTANLKNDAAALDEVAGLLTELRGAWDSIGPQTIQPAAQPDPVANAVRTYART